MKLTEAEVGHFRYLVEELLFRLKEDEDLLITDLEDQIKICAEILGINPNIEQEDTGNYD